MIEKINYLWRQIAFYFVYKAITGRKPTQSEILLFAKTCKKSNEIIANALKSQHVIKKIIELNAETLVRYAYHGILNRDPDAPGLNALTEKLRANSDYVDLISAFSNCDENVARINKKITASNNKYLTTSSYHELNLILESKVRFTLVFVPENNWLPFTLALSKNLALDGHNILLVTFSNNNLSTEKKQWLSGMIDTKTIGLLASSFRPRIKCMYIHSFGWQNNTNELIDLFPEAIINFYSDGFKNDVKRDLNKYNEIAYFGFDPIKITTKKRIIKFDEWLSQVRSELPAIAQKKQETLSFKTIICLRYYGLGPYQLCLEDLLELIWQTSLAAITSGEPIIIKPDKRHPSLSSDVISYFQKKHNATVSDLNELLPGLATQPLEVIIETGALDLIEKYVVFDSSLSYIIAHHPHITKGTKIYLGAKINTIIDFKNDNIHSELEKSKLEVYRIIYKNTLHYANQLITDSLQYKKICDSLYVFHK